MVELMIVLMVITQIGGVLES
ncbi:hypothetical protein M8C21_004983 [Ambrosia artemisiifolia]|uniref:Uncharacterized protein n=1 Tax=Ambrosia artemisiifolia TaxID=4212 RepID=A0AAD5GUT0_AMBAR|nr:hypothetical protein M8C21_004983 [Ambrosia artemisiifolia]